MCAMCARMRTRTLTCMHSYCCCRSPATVLTMSLIFISFVIVLHIYGKFTQ
ncbi:preprotein translocase subunit Sec61beta [archaeon]|nr:MAG: preprotein translocase subunit Sec61beta [archaeon]